MDASSSIQDRRAPPGLNLSSNNPFRRAASPSHLSPSSPTKTNPFDKIDDASAPRQSPRPISTNPFLDSYKVPVRQEPPHQRRASPPKPLGTAHVEIPHKGAATSDLFGGLSLNDKHGPSKPSHGQGAHSNSGTMPIPVHRTRRSGDDPRSRRDPHTNHHGALDIFASPRKDENKRPVIRRNSESSIFSFKEEDKRRERRHREDSKTKDRKGREGRHGRPKKPSQRLDVIDKLDVTSIYGGPSSFHHDGPFDACNPHRNRKGLKGAPMQAFPTGSANNTLGGSGPVNKIIDYDGYHGRSAEGYSDFNATVQYSNNREEPRGGFRRPYYPPRSNSYNQEFSRETTKETMRNYNPDAEHDFNAKLGIEQVHGDPSLGLGTSTFLEGTPVSRKDIIRRESEPMEDGANGANGGGLQRKRSIAQKIRGISRPRPGGHGANGGSGDAGRMTSPETRHGWVTADQTTSPGSPEVAPTGPQNAGGHGKVMELNPFFNEQPEKKSANVSVAATGESSGRIRTASSPTRGLARVRTSEDQADGDKVNAGGGGLLGRMKSLKGKKSRPERFGGAGA